MNNRTFRLFCTLVSICFGVALSLDSAAATFTSKSTGYFPHNSKMEGGYKDRVGKRLYTLQAYLRGAAPYVSVAMDSNAFRYGTKLRIKELEEFYGKKIEFRVVDTGGAFRRKGTSRIDICTDSRQATLHKMVNRHLTITTDLASNFSAPTQKETKKDVVKTTPMKTDAKVTKPVPTTAPIVSSSNLKGLIRDSLLENREILNANPRDMAKFCPQYYTMSQQERADVWTEMVLAMAQSSSGLSSRKIHTEGISDASGNLVISRGLLQISGESARSYRCDLSQNSDLHNDSTNIKCGLKIIQKLLGRDDEVGNGVRRGLGRYWGTFSSASSAGRVRAKVSSVAACGDFSKVATNQSNGGSQ